MYLALGLLLLELFKLFLLLDSLLAPLGNVFLELLVQLGALLVLPMLFYKKMLMFLSNIL